MLVVRVREPPCTCTQQRSIGEHKVMKMMGSIDMRKRLKRVAKVLLGGGSEGCDSWDSHPPPPTPPPPPPPCASSGGERWCTDTATGPWDTETGLRDTETGLRDTVTGLRDTVTGLRDTATGLRDTVTGLRDTETGLRDTVTGLRDTVTGLRDTETGLRDTVTGLRDTETGLRDTVTGLRDTVTGLRDTETGLRDTVTGLRDTVTGLRDTETGLRDTVTGLRDTVTGLRDTETGLRDTETGLRDTVTGLRDTETGLRDTGHGDWSKGHGDPMRLVVDPRHLLQLMLEEPQPASLGATLGATLGPRNSTPAGGEGPQQHSFPWAVTLLAGVLITTIVVDVVGNMLVILSVFRNRKLRKTGNAFVVSLALADLLVAIYPYPLVLSAIFHDGWIAGYIHCQISGFLMGLSVIGSIFNITGIAVNRYCFICHSLKYDRLFSGANTVGYVALVWALTVLAIVPNWFVESLQYDPRVYSCTFAQSVSSLYTIAVVVVHFVLPIAVVTYCYLRIWILVIRVRRRVKPDSRPKIKPHDLRNFLTMFVVFVLFAVCWAPLNLIGLAVALDPGLGRAIPEWLFTASYFMAYFNSCLNAVVYGALNHNFRKEYKRIVLIIFRFHC
ncbi:melatonin receptor type 1A-like [Entelurus aequoreus]|uniref:melatonin receptor type 1A-like n=1 Tax=Entelurus aequoreus TaxID=161455 RepID=UPI002B1DA5D3|nr:melatonin receptor type 1A-like [Entelurus aequoreus]